MNSINRDREVADARDVVHLRNYFETDFPSMMTVRYTLSAMQGQHEAKLFAQAHVDFASHTKFCSFYIPPDTGLPTIELCKTMLALVPDVLALRRGSEVYLPRSDASWTGTGVQLGTFEYLDVKLLPVEGGQFDTTDFPRAPPIYVYCDADLADSELQELIRLGQRHNATIRFRGQKYAKERIRLAQPLAFISHDHRDKDAIARPLAIGLSQRGYSVWFDEFTLKPGDRLRESIEEGIRKCRRCILVLTPNFLSNKGWGAAEFNSVFTREILEEKAIVVPLWSEVTKQEVFKYSPGLLNVVGAHWDPSNSEKAIREIARALTV